MHALSKIPFNSANATPKLVIDMFWFLTFSNRERSCFLVNIHAPQWIINLYSDKSSGKSTPLTLVISNFPPTFFSNRKGSFSRAISPLREWWVHDSAIKTLSFGFSKL